jgi:hypothetical protein
MFMSYIDLTDKTGAAVRVFLPHVIYVADQGAGVTKFVLDNREELELTVSYPSVIRLMNEQMEHGGVLGTG